MAAIGLAYMMWRSFVDGQVVTEIVFCTGLISTVAVCVSTVVLPVIRISGNIHRGETARIRESFSRPPRPDDDRGLPPDAFVGYEPDLIGRMIDRGVDLWVQGRVLRRVLRSQAR